MHRERNSKYNHKNNQLYMQCVNFLCVNFFFMSKYQLYCYSIDIVGIETSFVTVAIPTVR